MNIKQTSLIFTLTALFAGASTLAGVHAAGSKCEVIYGGGYYGGEICDEQISFSLDKQIQKPTKGGEFVNNLGANDEKFAPGQTVIFRIIIENTGSKTIENISVVDTLPNHLAWVSGGRNNGNQVTYTLEKLDPGKSHTGTITTKVVDSNILPTDTPVICVTNTVKATQNSRSATDSTQLCIERGLKQKDGGPVVQQTPPLKQTPQTGPGALSLFALIPAGAFGLFLNRKAIR